MDPKYNQRINLRHKANYAKKFRCNTLICVLENPRFLNNVASVIRNIDTLGIGKLYVIDGYNILPQIWETMRTNKTLNCISSSAVKWAYIKKFETTSHCISYLRKNNFTSIITSPHLKGIKNTFLSNGRFTHKKLAVWFGNESKGVSQEVIDNCIECIQIEMSGIVESLNLAVSTGIVLYTIAQQRRKYNKMD